MKRKKKDILQTGWDNNNDDDKDDVKKQYKSNSLSSKQIVKNKNKQNILERIVKWVIYAILFIAMPNYIKSSKTKGKEIVNSAYSKINSNEFAFVPAGYAMYLFLSFIPTLGLAVGIIGAINESYETVINVIILGQLIPGIKEVMPAFSLIWQSAGGITAFILLTLSILWLGSKGYAKFILSFDALYEHKSTNLVWRTRVKGFLTSIFITCSLIIALLIASSFLNFILKNGFGVVVTDKIELSNLPWEFQLIFWLPTIIFLPAITYASFLLFFKFSPNFKLKFSHVNPGSLIAAIPTSFYILIFGSLTSLINYKKFGVVASFMYIILLLSVMSYFIYSGVIVNSSFYKTFVNLPTIQKQSIFNRKRV
ncbi:YihY/virulence factor BrkB family protein [Metamycoplasma phocicerebrale]|uniref:YihY/virulence factor BrkB family protein n=1 Tax=Metamycoplasma phocicerebrale TaxID=142649 RepID=A0A3T0TTJ5_9BACT|nr:YhjD/YihY/BrkB family envelope integrity protein [Metamycoplasma phocicerebrale]AZZ65296.1 YihY/virulence factor BrkB family protein [Metamycoplasma phocicerebrale]